jgi:hypothetical protein
MMFLHNSDSFESQYGDVEWAPVSFPVAQDWFKYHNKLSYMYGDPPEILFISMVSFRWPDSIGKTYQDAKESAAGVPVTLRWCQGYIVL